MKLLHDTQFSLLLFFFFFQIIIPSSSFSLKVLVLGLLQYQEAWLGAEEGFTARGRARRRRPWGLAKVRGLSRVSEQLVRKDSV